MPDNETDDFTETNVDEPITETPSSEGKEQTIPTATAIVDGARGRNKFTRPWQWALSHKKIAIPTLVVIFLGLLAGIPWTRYQAAGLVLQQNFVVKVVESDSRKPVSGVTVQIDASKTVTDSQGYARVRTKVGSHTLQADKKYYDGVSQATLVPIAHQKEILEVRIKAVGRQVPVTVVDKISKRAIPNAVIAALGADTKTDSKGQAVIVLPAEKTKVDVKITASAYNASAPTVTVTADVVEENTFSMTPAGSVYFLSNKSGKIDLVKSDLDGANRKTVVAGTGSEEQYETRIIASYDWKYIAFLSRRDGGDTPKLFMLDTSNDSLSTVDSNKANFTLSGWSGHNFVYLTNLHDVDDYTAKKETIKSFDSVTKKVLTLDESSASETYYEAFGSPMILGKEVVYTRDVYTSGTVPEARAAFMATRADGTSKRAIKTWDAPNGQYVNFTRGDVGELRFAVSSDVDNHLYTYKDGTMRTVADKTSDDLYDVDSSPYALSPSGELAFWSAQRDGKSTFFTSPLRATDRPDQITELDSGYQVYGWFTDNYVLISKNNNGLYIMGATSLSAHQAPTWIGGYFMTDYSGLAYGNGAF